MHSATPLAAQGASAASDAEIRLLLSRLDLSRPGLEAVKAAADDPARAAEALLVYYRARTTVRQPIERSARPAMKGHYATPEQLKRADNAVQHIFYANLDYPPQQFGAEIDWFTNRSTTQDNEWVWQLNRQSWWNDLTRAYWHTGDERYARAWVEQLRDWVRNCPRDSHSPAWRTLEAGIRGYAWVGQFMHFVDSPSVTPRDLVLCLNACWEHATYLVDGRSFSKNNWGLMEAEGTAFIAMTFPEFAGAEGWRDKAMQFIAAQILVQVRPDGHHVEETLNYHAGCISWFARTAQLAKLNGVEATFPPVFWERLEAMCQVLVAVGFPDGSSPQFGDTHSPVRWQHQIEEWGKFFQREDFCYAASAGAVGTPPNATAVALKESGFYAFRSGWDREATCLVLKNGPDGGWHCQPDNGTFELYAGGRRLMPDSGTYIYFGNADAQAARAWFRQTRVHQTLTLDGANTAYRPQLLLWQPGETLDTLVVENAGYAQLTHRRAVLFVKKRFVVLVDDALGRAAGDVDLHFQLLPCTPVVDPAGLSFRSDLATGTNVLVQTMPQPGVTLAAEEGWVSYQYAAREPRPAFRYRLRKDAASAGVRFVTLVIPYAGTTPPAAEVRVLDGAAPGASRVRLDVRVGETHEIVEYRLPE